jgi:hypothetical protein
MSNSAVAAAVMKHRIQALKEMKASAAQSFAKAPIFCGVEASCLQQQQQQQQR